MYFTLLVCIYAGLPSPGGLPHVDTLVLNCTFYNSSPGICIIYHEQQSEKPDESALLQYIGLLVGLGLHPQSGTLLGLSKPKEWW